MEGGVYICLCMVVTRLQIEEAIASGARSLEDIGVRCKAGTDCGKCRPAIIRLLAAAESGLQTPRPGPAGPPR